MVRRIGSSICALVLLIVSTVADAAVVTGTVRQVDEGSGVIVLEDGGVVRTTSDTLVLVDGRSLPLSAVVPGTRVVVVTTNPALGHGVSDGPQPPALPGGWMDTEGTGRGLRPDGIHLDEEIQAP